MPYHNVIYNRPPVLRKPAVYVNPEEEDFVFQVLDCNVTNFGDVDPLYPAAVPESFVYMHGVTNNLQTVVVQFCGHKPYFYLSVPEGYPDRDFIGEIRKKLEAYEIEERVNFQHANSGSRFNFRNHQDDVPRKRKLDFRELYRMEMVNKHTAVGFRDGQTMPFIKFSFFTMRTFREFQRALDEIFPSPTKEDIQNKIYRNEFIICEHKDVPEMRFFDEEDVISAGWARLKKGKYRFLEGKAKGTYNFTTKDVEPVLDNELIAPCYIDSFDIETVRDDGQHALPNPKSEKDVIASIGHVIQRSDRKEAPIYVLWTWVSQESRKLLHIEKQNAMIRFMEDGQVKAATLKRNKYTRPQLAHEIQRRMNKISDGYNSYTVRYDETIGRFVWNSEKPFRLIWTDDTAYQECGCELDETDDTYLEFKSLGYVYPCVRFPIYEENGKLLPKREIVVMEYDREEDLFNNWGKWFGRADVSTDIITGWNILGYDLGWIYQRMKALVGIEDEAFEWGRLRGVLTQQKQSKIESKAIAHQKYTETPSHGRVFIDDKVLFQRDVTKKYTRYTLEHVSQEMLGEGKAPVHYPEIKGLFYGSPEERGRLFWYNLKDCELVQDLMKKAGHFEKSIHIARVNRVLLNHLCTHGQQLRVYGGMRYVAHKNNTVIWRPHWHPILDNPIIDKSEDDVSKFDQERTAKFWTEMLDQTKTEAPEWSMVEVDEHGACQEIRVDEKQVKDMMDITENNQDDSDDENPFIIEHRKAPKKPPPLAFPKRPPTVEVSHPAKRQKTFVPPIITREQMKNCKTALGHGVLDVIHKSRQTFSGPRNKNLSANKYVTSTADESRRTVSVVDVIKSNKSGKDLEDVLDENHGLRADDEDDDNDNDSKGFSGGMVMEPEPGLYWNIIILDFNSLYPNLMMTHGLDPALLVLDLERFGPGKCKSGTKFLKVKMSNNNVYYYAQGHPGVLIQHTKNLVAARKVAQEVMKLYEKRLDNQRLLLKRWLESANDKLDDLVAEAKKLNDESSERDIESRWHLTVQTLETEEKLLCNILKDIAAYKQGQLEIPQDVDLLLETAEKELHGSACPPIQKGALKNLIDNVQILVERAKLLRQQIPGDKISAPPTRSKAVISEILAILDELSAGRGNYDAKQNELKVGCNSTFGFVGAGKDTWDAKGRLRRTGKVPAKPVAAAVTWKGRESIEEAKEIAEKFVPGSKVIYGDTDSLFWDAKFGNRDARNEAFDLGKRLADAINADFQKRKPGTMKIEMEKLAEKFLIYSAKCYAYYKVVSRTSPGKTEIKGLQFTKRDFAPIANRIGYQAINKLFTTGDVEGSKKYVQDEISQLINRDFGRRAEKCMLEVKRRSAEHKLLQCKVASKELAKSGASRQQVTKSKELVDAAKKHLEDVNHEVKELEKVIEKEYEDLAIFKKLNKKSYNGKLVGHAALAQRMEQRTPGLGPSTGDSVKFLYCYDKANDCVSNRKQSMDKQIEDYEYVIKNNLNVDVLWYLRNQIKTTVTKVFSVLMKDPEELLYDAIGRQMNKQMGAVGRVEDVAESYEGNPFLEDVSMFPIQ